ncbi:MAG: hypothetical protein AAGC74_03645 [Verrucomicrobiota bacterium]
MNDPGVTSSDDDVIFYGPIGNVQPLLREGDPVPGDPSRTVGSLSLFDAFEMGSDGSLAFEFSTSPSVFQGEIWIARPDNSIVPLALHDQVITIDGEDWTIDGADFANSGAVSFIIDRTGRNGTDGRPSALGSNGQFVFMANMALNSGGSNRQVLVLADLEGSTPLIVPSLTIQTGLPNPDDLRISFETETGQDYSVYRCPTLNGTPTQISGPTPGTGTTVNVDDTDALLDPKNFYYSETE